jgi:hypothetical protein
VGQTPEGEPREEAARRDLLVVAKEKRRQPEGTFWWWPRRKEGSQKGSGGAIRGGRKSAGRSESVEKEAAVQSFQWEAGLRSDGGYSPRRHDTARQMDKVIACKEAQNSNLYRACRKRCGLLLGQCNLRPPPRLEVLESDAL